MPFFNLLNNGEPPLMRGDPVMVPAETSTAHVAAGGPKGGGWGELKIDISSEEAARQSLLRHFGCEDVKDTLKQDADDPAADGGIQQRGAPGDAWGTVLGADMKANVVEVLVWRKGDTFFVGGNKRPKMEFPITRVKRVTPVEFWKNCRKGYMLESRRYLRLKGEGHDESIPLSLIAYHNKMINKLLEKTDGGAKPPTLKVADKSDRQFLGGQKAKLDILRNHGPVTQNTSDPFGDIAEQLKALASVGIGGGKKAKASATHKRSQRALVSGVGDRGGAKTVEEQTMALPGGAAPSAQTADASAMHRHFHTAQARTLQSLTHRLQDRRKTLMRTMSQAARKFDRGTEGTVVVSAITQGLGIRVADPAGGRGDAVAVRLAHVAFGTTPHHVEGTRAYLTDLLLGQQVTIAVRDYTAGGVPLVDMRFPGDKDTVQAALVSAGHAQVLHTADEPGLIARKKRAAHEKVGIWAAMDVSIEKAMAATGLTPLPEAPPVPLPPSQARAHRAVLEGLGEVDAEEAEAEVPPDKSHHLGSLFDHYFASQEFLSMAKSSPFTEYC